MTRLSRRFDSRIQSKSTKSPSDSSRRVRWYSPGTLRNALGMIVSRCLSKRYQTGLYVELEMSGIEMRKQGHEVHNGMHTKATMPFIVLSVEPFVFIVTVPLFKDPACIYTRETSSQQTTPGPATALAEA